MMQLEEQCGFICYDLETVPRYIKQKKKERKGNVYVACI